MIPDQVPLSEAKRRLLEKALRGELSHMPAGHHTIPRRPRDRPIPLSFAQQRLWFLDQLSPGNCAYNVGQIFRLRGPIDIDALRRSVEEIARRHESLRTTFAAIDGQPVQVIAAAAPIEIPILDLTTLPDSTRTPEAQRIATAEVERPFDLAHGPLFRIRLIRLGREEHLLLSTMHHIISEDWSIGVLFRELEVLYGAFSRREPSPLPPVFLQYADYAVWERERLQGDVLEKQLAYWTTQLRDAPAILDLRGDRRRPALRSSRGGRQRFALPTSVAERIAAVSREGGVTLYMTLLAAFAVLLWRQTGQEEILVGSPISGRNRVETEDLIGLFINTIVLRTDLRGNPSFRELMLRVRETALGAYAHQEMPFEKLVDALKLDRSLSHNPLFQVWFVLQNVEGTPFALAGLSVNEIMLETEAIRHDLQLSISGTSGGLSGKLDYAADIFDAPTIARLARDFEALLVRIAAQPEASILQLRKALDEDALRQEQQKQEELERESVERLRTIKRKAVRL